MIPWIALDTEISRFNKVGKSSIIKISIIWLLIWNSNSFSIDKKKAEKGYDELLNGKKRTSKLGLIRILRSKQKRTPKMSQSSSKSPRVIFNSKSSIQKILILHQILLSLSFVIIAWPIKNLWFLTHPTSVRQISEEESEQELWPQFNQEPRKCEYPQAKVQEAQVVKEIFIPIGQNRDQSIFRTWERSLQILRFCLLSLYLVSFNFD